MTVSLISQEGVTKGLELEVLQSSLLEFRRLDAWPSCESSGLHLFLLEVSVCESLLERSVSRFLLELSVCRLLRVCYHGVSAVTAGEDAVLYHAVTRTAQVPYPAVITEPLGKICHRSEE